MTRTYDLLVVGAGIGGLTAGALAAHAGAGTLVIEAHNRPGGCAGDFALDGLLFPAGATLISGFEPGGMHDLVYRMLGIDHRARPLDRAMEIVTPERRVNLWTDRDRWDEEWRRAFPGQEAAKSGFLHWAERLGGVVHRLASRLPVLPPRAPRDLARLASALRPETLLALPYLPRTVGSVLERAGVHDTGFRQLIDGQLFDATGCLADSCAALGGSIAIDLYHRGCFALPNGTAEIAADLVRSLRRDGGAMRYGERVVALRPAGGQWLVRTEAGGEYQARTVVANLPVWDLPRLLDGPQPARLRRSGHLRAHAWGAAVLHAAVDAAVLAPEEQIHVQVLPEAGAPLAECSSCFITVLPGRRPGGPRAVSVSTHTDAAPWWTLDREQYQERRAAYIETLVSACSLAFPGFRSRLRFARLATPRTFQHFTQRGLGLVGGIRNDVARSLFGAVSHRTGVPGLYLCGDRVFPAQGTIGVTLSGINAWRSARDDLAKGTTVQMTAVRRPATATIG